MLILTYVLVQMAEKRFLVGRLNPTFFCYVWDQRAHRPGLQGEAELALGTSTAASRVLDLTFYQVRAAPGVQDKYDLNRAKKDESRRRSRFDEAYKKNTKRYSNTPKVMKKLLRDFEVEETQRHEWDIAHVKMKL